MVGLSVTANWCSPQTYRPSPRMLQSDGFIAPKRVRLQTAKTHGLLSAVPVKLRETIQIEAPPEVVWNFVSDPEAWPRWNPRVKQVRRDRRGALAETEQFAGVFQLSGAPMEHSVEIVRLDPPKSLVMRQRYEWQRRPCEIEISISVEPRPTGSCVITVIDASKAGIPWPFRLLIWWISLFGHKVGSSPLDALKRLAEQVPGAKAA